jgi:N-glycosylase/DNA lyase
VTNAKPYRSADGLVRADVGSASIEIRADEAVRAPTSHTITLPLCDYDLAATLASGQAFRWRERNGAWEGVVAGRWVRLRSEESAVRATAAEAQRDWTWLTGYLRVDEDLRAILATFPDDTPMREAVASCSGLRLLRQEQWECLASFILSSTKQIVQIQECVALLCLRFGQPIPAPPEAGPQFAFPTWERIAAASEAELRPCKLGFRAKYLLGTARQIAAGELDLTRVAELPTAEARAALMNCPGVGRKIADCVLLFAYGRQDAFPVDVWVLKAIRGLYFPRRRPSPKRLIRFTETHFGPFAGYAQQYLFHYVRTRLGRSFGKKPGSK